MSDETNKKSVYETLSAIDCRNVSKKKNGLTYLPWAWAWARVKENYPGATYTIYENKEGLNYHHDGRTAWVKTGVTIEGLEMIEDLPVMDYKNRSILLEDITSFDVTKSIQRCLTKACARHGLGLYIFAGEDLPEGAEDAEKKADEAPKEAPAPAAKKKARSAATKMDDAVKAKAHEAWALCKELDIVKKMNESSKSKYFFSVIKEHTGKDDPTNLTVDEWGAVINALDIVKAI